MVEALEAWWSSFYQLLRNLTGCLSSGITTEKNDDGMSLCCSQTSCSTRKSIVPTPCKDFFLESRFFPMTKNLVVRPKTAKTYTSSGPTSRHPRPWLYRQWANHSVTFFCFLYRAFALTCSKWSVFDDFEDFFARNLTNFSFRWIRGSTKGGVINYILLYVSGLYKK